MIGVIVLETAVSALGLTGSVASAKGILPDLAANAQEAARAHADSLGKVFTDADFLAAGQSGTESVIPAIARLPGLPIVVGLLLVATMMAIIVSTADSFLLIPATNLTRDVYQRFFAKDADEVRVLQVSRILVLALGALAFLLAGMFKTVLDAAYTAYNIYGTSIAPALLAAFLWKRATRTGAVASIVTGTTVTLVWTYVLPKIDALGFDTWSPFLQELTYPAATLSVLALVVGSLLTPAPGREVWGAFFKEEDEVDSTAGGAV